MTAPRVCPCGCGRKVGWGPHKKGAAIGYVEADMMLVFVEPILRDSLEYDDPSPRERSEMEKFIYNGKQLRGWLLEHIHGTASPSRTPDMMQLQQALEAFREDAAAIAASAEEMGHVVSDGHGNLTYLGRTE